MVNQKFINKKITIDPNDLDLFQLYKINKNVLIWLKDNADLIEITDLKQKIDQAIETIDSIGE